MGRSGKKKKTGVPQVQCGWNKCGFVCEQSLELNSHIRKHLEQFNNIPGEMIHCPWRLCDYSTCDANCLHRHIYYHGYNMYLLTLGKFEMDMNPKVPKCTITVENRYKIPNIDLDFHCQWADCSRTFCSIIEFQDHIVQHALFEYEMQKTPEIACPKVRCNWQFCSKILNNKYRLMEHICKHSNKKQYACWQCGEYFRTKTTLFDHSRRQPVNNTHKYQCAQCFKFFGTEKLLRAHEVKHFNYHKCSMCDMTCNSYNTLAIHIRYRHLKDKPFKCSECNYCCVRKADLEKHRKHTHDRETHYCDQPGCSYSVRTYNLLRRHYLEVHGDNPYIYVCNYCDKLFKCAKSLSSHLIKIHEVKHSSGHKRFTFCLDENGFYRLQTMRIESLDVINEILSPNSTNTSEILHESNSYKIVCMTDKDKPVSTLSETDNAAVGEVIISVATNETESTF